MYVSHICIMAMLHLLKCIKYKNTKKYKRDKNTKIQKIQKYKSLNKNIIWCYLLPIMSVGQVFNNSF